jgi:hypothetical protein
MQTRQNDALCNPKIYFLAMIYSFESMQQVLQMASFLLLWSFMLKPDLGYLLSLETMIEKL